MLVDSKPGVSPWLCRCAKLLLLGAATQEIEFCGLLSLATRCPRLFTLKGESKPQSWNSSVDTVGTLARYAHVCLEFTRTFRLLAGANWTLRVPEHLCNVPNRSSIGNIRQGELGIFGTRALNSKQLTESRHEFMKAVLAPT